jgi:hypothetical protein
MTRDEWNARLAVEPVTPNQRGAIMHECERLGLVSDRAERLALLGTLAGAAALGSTADLTMGQAGQVIGTLRDARDRDDLAALVAERQAVEHTRAAGQLTVAEALRQIALTIYAALLGTGTETDGPMPNPISGDPG